VDLIIHTLLFILTHSLPVFFFFFFFFFYLIYSIGYLSNLKHFDIASNLVTGKLPDTIKQLTNLVLFSTSGNNFSKQTVHDYFYNMPNLKDLSMKGNNFTGTLPSFFGEINSLQLLDLESNQLTGEIPTWYGLMTNLHVLMLNRNYLTGTG
jgi:LRR receptor-like serine/threonine-protein kinase EFR